MNELRKMIVSFFGIIVSMGTTIMVMIHGWGLEPQSWTWIILWSFLGSFLAVILVYIGGKVND